MKLFDKTNIVKFGSIVFAIYILDFIVDVILMGKSLTTWKDELISLRILIVFGVSIFTVFISQKKKSENASSGEF